MRGHMVEEERTEDDSRYTAQQHPKENAVVNLPARDLDRDDDQLDHGRKGERGATAISTGTWRKSISNGAVITPAPTPVRAITTAIKNPITNCSMGTLFYSGCT